jgi:hypothetical protein
MSIISFTIFASGACRRIQEFLGYVILWLACMHHVCELLLGAVWYTMLTAKTKKPADELCEAHAKFCEGETYPLTLYASSCPFIFKDDDPFFVSCRKNLVKLKERLGADASGRKSALPRGDYDYFFALILVSQKRNE